MFVSASFRDNKCTLMYNDRGKKEFMRGVITQTIPKKYPKNFGSAHLSVNTILNPNPLDFNLENGIIYYKNTVPCTAALTNDTDFTGYEYTNDMTQLIFRPKCNFTTLTDALNQLDEARKRKHKSLALVATDVIIRVNHNRIILPYSVDCISNDIVDRSRRIKTFALLPSKDVKFKLPDCKLYTNTMYYYNSVTFEIIDHIAVYQTYIYCIGESPHYELLENNVDITYLSKSSDKTRVVVTHEFNLIFAYNSPDTKTNHSITKDAIETIKTNLDNKYIFVPTDNGVDLYTITQQSTYIVNLACLPNQSQNDLLAKFAAVFSYNNTSAYLTFLRRKAHDHYVHDFLQKHFDIDIVREKIEKPDTYNTMEELKQIHDEREAAATAAAVEKERARLAKIKEEREGRNIDDDTKIYVSGTTNAIKMKTDTKQMSEEECVAKLQFKEEKMQNSHYWHENREKERAAAMARKSAMLHEKNRRRKMMAQLPELEIEYAPPVHSNDIKNWTGEAGGLSFANLSLDHMSRQNDNDSDTICDDGIMSIADSMMTSDVPSRQTYHSDLRQGQRDFVDNDDKIILKHGEIVNVNKEKVYTYQYGNKQIIVNPEQKNTIITAINTSIPKK